MALVAYTRVRLLWGALDVESDPDAPTYHAGNTIVVPSLQILGRRAVLEWDRSALGLDAAQTHLDIANITSGQLDDSWSDSDFTTCETNLQSFWNAWKSMVHTSSVLSHIRWYRVGPGATPPEPAVRTLAVNLPGTSTSSPMPAQLAENITWRTGLRKAWGRAYLPTLSSAHVGGGGDMLTPDVDTIANAANTLIGNLAGSDFMPFVYSKVHQKGYAIEKVSVDNIFDTQRRRRHRTPAYRKTIP